VIQAIQAKPSKETRMKPAMNPHRRALLAALSLGAGLPAAFAQDAYPSKPIRILLGYTAGSSGDVILRLLADPLGKRLGQTIIVENRPGAGGNIAAAVVAKAPPDGYTLLLAPSGHASNAAMKKHLPFDPLNDFAWISTVTTYPLALAVRPDSPLKSFQDLVQRIKAEPGRVTYTSVGVGTAMHLFGEWMLAEIGGSAIHVPYQGGPAMMTALLAGQVDLMIDAMPTAGPLIRDKRVRALAVTSPAGQSPVSGVPAVADTYPSLVFQSWQGIAAPAGTPAAIVDRLNRELRAVLDLPNIRQRMNDLGVPAQGSTPGEFHDRVANDIRQMTRVVTERKLETTD
jgi:tripartite-type tricarboxylate transporter receptor subunit TctC